MPRDPYNVKCALTAPTGIGGEKISLFAPVLDYVSLSEHGYAGGFSA